MGLLHSALFCHSRILLSPRESNFRKPKMKLFLVLALVVVSFGGLNAAVIPEDVDLTAAKREILSDDEIAKIILDVISQSQSEAYGIMDIITKLPGLIKDLKPLLTKYLSIIMDGSLTISQKVSAIWEHTKDNMGDIIAIAGKAGAMEILKQLVIAAAGALGR